MRVDRRRASQALRASAVILLIAVSPPGPVPMAATAAVQSQLDYPKLIVDPRQPAPLRPTTAPSVAVVQPTPGPPPVPAAAAQVSTEAPPAADGHSATAVVLPPVGGTLDLPGVAVAAYQAAAARLAQDQPGCGLTWTLLAGIGRIESGHARGRVDASGTTLEPILGPVLDGTANNAAITDTDKGRYDNDPVWDRAVGPMQFIPGTWLRWGADGNGDAIADPNNIADAALGATSAREAWTCATRRCCAPQCCGTTSPVRTPTTYSPGPRPTQRELWPFLPR